MTWTSGTLLTLFMVLFALSLSQEVDSVTVPSRDKEPQGLLRRIFMKESDASNFFKRRSRREVKSQDEINAEQRQVLAADERRREFHQEKRQEFESYAEEEHDEQNERTRESTEQWREFHYDGMYPPHEYNRHAI
ncbi:unique cartilage matrix-associated protein [Synchiropus splendidus]|uniref:unique cartilage matrix-associated protein n=1 Tax=Synchiropus splendidus TaxID=270530 RepID=UPI00237D9BA5|nr:unique cartilage matrix-associated protein [Synchiropus splendidus]XP_053741517.1 unique cartilage matrix-associated protein [Synchiropus splendidus]